MAHYIFNLLFGKIWIKNLTLDLDSIHPGHSLEEIIEMTGFEFDEPSTIRETKPPSSDTLKLIRGKIADEISETYPAFSSKLFGA